MPEHQVSPELGIGSLHNGTRSQNHRLRMQSSFLNWLMPFALYLMLASPGDAWTEPLVAAVGSLAILDITYLIANKFGRDKLALGVGIACIVVLLIGWAMWRTPDPYFWGFPVLTVISMFRAVRLIVQDSLTSENRFALRVDCILVCLVLPLLWMVEYGNVTFAKAVVFLAVVALIGRVFVVWNAERFATATRERSAGLGLTLLGLAGIALGLYGGHLLRFAIVIVVYAFLFLLSPFLFMLPSKFEFVDQLKHNESVSAVGNKLYKGVPPTHIVPQSHALVQTMYYVVGVLFIIGIAIYIWRLQARQSRAGVESAPGVVRRRWVGEPVRGLRFAKTTDPIRVKYQDWLHALHKRGQTMLPHETARQFERRMVESGVVTDVPSADDLRDSYEVSRYQAKDGEGTVSDR